MTGWVSGCERAPAFTEAVFNGAAAVGAMVNEGAHAASEVGQLMTVDVITCEPDQTAQDAAEVMARGKVGAVVIVDEDQTVLGLLTERDLVSKVVAPSRVAREVLVRDVMSAPAIGVQPEDTLDRVLKRMNEFHYRRLPVMRGSRLAGMISQTDLLRQYPNLVASHRW